MDSMRIGELVERSGRTPRTLHFYEELGLLHPVGRTKGGFRLYDQDALLRIQWISRLQDLGFSLPDIRTFLQALQEHQSAPAMMGELRSFYETKLQETRQQIARLRALEHDLHEAIAYLGGCRACDPATGKTACRPCGVDEHAGHDAPPMVAAVQS
jgi:DNA-binding transcriptional MerR regulator